MVPSELMMKVKKIFDVLDTKLLINNTYINPFHIDRISDKIPELQQAGFDLSKTETESKEGNVVSAHMRSPSGQELDLGSVILTGKEIKIQKSLLTVDDFVRFVEDNISNTVDIS